MPSAFNLTIPPSVATNHLPPGAGASAFRGVPDGRAAVALELKEESRTSITVAFANPEPKPT